MAPDADENGCSTIHIDVAKSSLRKKAGPTPVNGSAQQKIRDIELRSFS
jgi:hypothetical protein